MRASGGALVLAALVTAGAVAPWLASRPPDLQEDPAGARLLPPFTTAHALRIEPERALVVTGLASSADVFTFDRAGVRGSVPRAAVLEAPSRRFYLLGTDALGRDLVSRLLYAIRRTVLVATACVILSTIIGVAVGVTAGFTGGAWDRMLMRLTDALMAIPRVLLYLACAAIVRPSTPLLIMVIAATTWTGLARLVRVQILALRENDGLLAARAVGPSIPRLVVRHVMPAIGPTIAVAASLRFADTVLLESALAFLGLSTPPLAVSLGTLIAAGRDSLADAWWLAACPGLVIVILVASLRSTVGGMLRVTETPSAT